MGTPVNRRSQSQRPAHLLLIWRTSGNTTREIFEDSAPMCGICGFHNLEDRGQASSMLQSMAGSLVHRGLDGTGTWLSASAATGLANTRLAIIDIAGGKQPIHSADGRYTIVYNGELYNFADLNADLE